MEDSTGKDRAEPDGHSNPWEDIPVEELAEVLFILFISPHEPEKFSMAMRVARLDAHNLKALTFEDPRTVSILSVFERMRKLDASNPSGVAGWSEKKEAQRLLLDELWEKLRALSHDTGMSTTVRILAEERQRRIASLKSIQADIITDGAEMGKGLTWLGEGIRDANENGDAELAKLLVRCLFINIGITTPIPGILSMSKQDPPGRPAGGSQERQKLYDDWEKMHFCPLPELAEVAYEEIYGEQFIREPQNGAQRKRRREQLKRCRTALLRECNAFFGECRAIFEELDPENTEAQKGITRIKKARLTILKQGR